MDTTFWNNLSRGRIYEEHAARYLEDRGWTVWRIGNFKQPFDLYAWKRGREPIFVEVKYRHDGFFNGKDYYRHAIKSLKVLGYIVVYSEECLELIELNNDHRIKLIWDINSLKNRIRYHIKKGHIDTVNELTKEKDKLERRLYGAY